MKNQPSTIQVVYHIFLPWQFYLVMGGCIVAAPCCLAEWVNNLSHGGFLKWANEELGVYWDFLSSVFSLGGWRHGFGAFWSAHPYLALGIFLAIPMMGIIATSLILKRARLAASIVLLLYAWHYGLSTFIHTHTQWMALLVGVGAICILLWGFRLVRFIRSKLESENKWIDEFLRNAQQEDLVSKH